ncbi:MAG: hypothetical protein IKG56_01195 [Clostridia bacterium]|nr:hypothetical protein [Clostridia bacterium]
MKTIIIVTIIILNAFSVFFSIRMLKGYDTHKIIIAVLTSELLVLGICHIIYAFTSGGIPNEVHQVAKKYIIYTMLPINMLIMFCPIANEVNKKSFGEVTDKKFNNRIMIYIIMIIVLLILEIKYVKNIQLGINN